MTDEYVFVFKAKKEHMTITDQDKKHFRIIATLELAHNNQIENLLNHNFSESFRFIKEDHTAIYKIRIIKERKGVKYADC